MTNKDYYMTTSEWNRFKQDRKLFNSLAKNRHYCKCGHSVTMSHRVERVMCSHCNLWVYRDEEKQKEYLEKLEEDEKKIKKDKFKEELIKHIRR